MSPAVDHPKIERAVEALRRGEMVVVVDAPGRENEGDLVMAAEYATAEAVNFMATHARGLICVAMREERLDELAIPPMANASRDPYGTAFYVSVDRRTGTTTGISAGDRAETIRALASPASEESDFYRPGHVFPLAAHEAGVLARPGHTEAAVDLMTLAGLSPAGVICEVAGEDGEMERLPGLIAFATRHGLQLLSVDDLITHRLRTESVVTRGASVPLPSDLGEFSAVDYRDHQETEHVALVLGDVAEQTDVLVHVHTECLAGDVFGSRRCDCGSQLESALRLIADEGAGAVVYLRRRENEGASAPCSAGRLDDPGDYSVAVQILKDLGAHRLRLLSSEAAEQCELEAYGLSILRRIPLIAEGTQPGLQLSV